MLAACQQKQTSAFDLIFLGTGTSGSVPNISCLTAPPEEEPCQTCLSTLTPEGKKNIRRNTSAIVRVDAVGGKVYVATFDLHTASIRRLIIVYLHLLRTILIDTGKNFQAAALEWFPKYGLRRIDAVLLTHGHADAINGLDDLRAWTLNSAIQPYIDLYVSQATLDEVKRAFPYLVSKEFASGGGDVPAFKWHIIDAGVPFEIEGTGIQVLPFCVHHGRIFSTPDVPNQAQSITLYTPPPTLPSTPTRSGMSTLADKVTPYISYGFLIQGSFIYISDVSFIPDETWALLEESRKCNGQPSIAVVDCLRLTKHTSHFGLREAISTARRIGAVRSYCVGFEHVVSHASYEKIFGAVGGQDDKDRLTVTEQEGIGMIEPGDPIWIRPAYDGLQVTVLEGGIVKDNGY
ncbi:hypothetical protein BDM02DRAFT_3185196 [Thelephora ganbajun]|uniref:Uncharacterized protein n=1 Tax=Thelephora ganbajun TaxID=370292 RepID=A0ACB6ZM60_THEGA|nr:hypothetical protein BDM02DRAFT_3185196 [Thelephora ganbajun]